MAALRLTAPCVYLCYRGYRRFFDSQNHPDDATRFFDTMRCIFRTAVCELLCTHSSVAYSKRKPHPGPHAWEPAVQCVAPIGCAVGPKKSQKCLLNVCCPRRGPKGITSRGKHGPESAPLTWTGGRTTPRQIVHGRSVWLLASGCWERGVGAKCSKGALDALTARYMA